MKLLVLTLALGLPLAAQHLHQPPPSEKPVTLLRGLGPLTHPIATTQPAAQQFFDQGLRLLYGFNHYESLRSFREAARLDPAAPMPLWGIAMALGPHINMDGDGDVNLAEGCQALARAQTLPASPYEKAYLDTAATRCPGFQPDRYIAATRRLHEQYPDDPDAATLYAESLMLPVRWAWWSPDGTPAPGTADAVSTLEQIMRRHPQHPGANHFYIHVVEMSPSPERAIPSAQRLMGIMPAAGHLVHMPGHIWLTLGDWETAAIVNERGAQVDRDYFAATGVQSAYLGYYIHNLHFVAYARSMQGRAADAIAAADRIAQDVAPVLQTMPEMGDVFVPYVLFTRVRFQRWNELLALPQPGPKLPTSVALWHWARALAALGQSKPALAQSEAQLFRTATAQVKPDWPWITNKAVDILALADAILTARLAPTPSESIAHWQRAVALQDALRYDEPPPWFMPLRESLGAALLRTGDPAAAEAVFRQGLRRTPNNGRLLFGLMTALQLQNKHEAAAFVRKEFEAAWHRADTPLRLEDL